MHLGLKSIAFAALRAVGLNVDGGGDQGRSHPKQPITTVMPSPRVRPAKTPRTQASAAERSLTAERRRHRYDMNPASASTLKKAMRLRRIENGTEGAHDPRHLR